MSDSFLPEDPDERRMFDQRAATYGGTLYAVSVDLRMLSIGAPPQGSLSKMLAIMSNEVRRAIGLVARSARLEAALYQHAQGIDGSGMTYCKMCGILGLQIKPEDHQKGCLLWKPAPPSKLARKARKE